MKEGTQRGWVWKFGKRLIQLSLVISFGMINGVSSYGDTLFHRNEINLIATVTMGEAGGESELGQRLVIDTILNRVDHSEFPDSITKVINQQSQYYTKCKQKSTSRLRRLIRQEMRKRTNYDVIFFRTKHYICYGEPLFKEGHHYFSSLEENKK